MRKLIVVSSVLVFLDLVASLEEANCTDEAFITKAIRLSTAVKCKPEATQVQVPFNPDDNSVKRIYPSHVKVRRCAGSCSGLRSTHCLPARKSNFSVPIAITRCHGKGFESRCVHSCATVQMEHHRTCMCGCQMLEKDCGEQDFNEATCSCDCNSKKELKAACLKHSLMVWNEQTCQCMCSPSVVTRCKNGEEFDYWSKCRCRPHHEMFALNETYFQLNPTTVEDPLDTLNISWELVTILALATLVFILSVSTILTMKKVAVLTAENSNWMMDLNVKQGLTS